MKSRSYDGPLSIAEAAYDAMRSMADRGDRGLDVNAHVMTVFDEHYIIPKKDRLPITMFVMRAMVEEAGHLSDKQSFVLTVAGTVATIVAYAGLKVRE